MKSIIAICILSLLLTACRNGEPVSYQQQAERRSTDAEIRKHIVGEWTAAKNSDGIWYPKLVIAADGKLFGVETNGKKTFVGTWEMSGNLLRVVPSQDRLAEARVSGVHINDWDYYPVIWADTHQLIMTPGISVAGRWRYVR